MEDVLVPVGRNGDIRHTAVLILVVVEDVLVLSNKSEWSMGTVLILVVVEDVLVRC